jgi:hypothetical protein
LFSAISISLSIPTESNIGIFHSFNKLFQYSAGESGIIVGVGVVVVVLPLLLNPELLALELDPLPPVGAVFIILISGALTIAGDVALRGKLLLLLLPVVLLLNLADDEADEADGAIILFVETVCAKCDNFRFCPDDDGDDGDNDDDNNARGDGVDDVVVATSEADDAEADARAKEADDARAKEAGRCCACACANAILEFKR